MITQPVFQSLPHDTLDLPVEYAGESTESSVTDERAYLHYQGQLTDTLCIMTDQLAALSTPDSLFIPVSFPTHLSHSATGLVDSSSMHCFIDTQFTNKLGLSPYNIHPLRLRLLDRSFSLRITRTIDLTICHSTGDVIGVTFYVTQLDSPVALIFGYNWLYRYN